MAIVIVMYLPTFFVFYRLQDFNVPWFSKEKKFKKILKKELAYIDQSQDYCLRQELSGRYILIKKKKKTVKRDTNGKPEIAPF